MLDLLAQREAVIALGRDELRTLRQRAEAAEALLTQRTQERDEALTESLRAHERLAELLEAHAGLQVRAAAAEGERDRLQARVSDAIGQLDRVMRDLEDVVLDTGSEVVATAISRLQCVVAVLRAPAAPPQEP